MPDSDAVHFFDIDSTLPGSSRSWSPNTLKVRLVLNFKGIPYTESWISYPDIEPLNKSLGLSPNEEGIPYTLPTIIHSSVKSNPHGALTDSFPIIQHLDKVFPSPPLFPSGDASAAIAIVVGKVVSRMMPMFLKLAIPKVLPILDPRGQECFERTRRQAFGKPVEELYPKTDAEFAEVWKSLETEAEVLLEMLRGQEGKKGPFFEGEKPGWADLHLVAFIAWFERSNQDVYEKLLGLGNGELKALYNACSPWLADNGTEKEWSISQ
ncbi:hypothetical protein N7468_009115 [Penicillium chermesinum]|uniref:GST N-terminal domain-containing protein n=1 Tax=Penicillium chermesinum TaxID=63820 RepID=A0A9W9NHG7_9EURO|nr:uncharacterized protein N7468_009115 [Penicillium chermesinum]KAJ5219911.1 hypothetical protein N7468_009115 [Penicillium chermesinum]